MNWKVLTARLKRCWTMLALQFKKNSWKPILVNFQKSLQILKPSAQLSISKLNDSFTDCKLFMTYFLAFNTTLNSESQNAQQHRAELDFEMSSIKEKIDVLDQGNFFSLFGHCQTMMTIRIAKKCNS